MKESLKHKVTIIVLGRSGSGKGTQAEFIVDHLGKTTRHIETGKILRTLIQKKSNATMRIASTLMEQGKLFPSWFGAFAWLKEIIEKGYGDKHLVFDGAPRKVGEAKLIDEVIGWHNRPAPLCVYVDISRSEATRRLLARGRDDDHKAAIKSRMDFFEKDVLPVVEYYRDQNRLLPVNGELSIEEVQQEIGRALASHLDKLWPSPSKLKKK